MNDPVAQQVEALSSPRCMDTNEPSGYGSVKIKIYRVLFCIIVSHINLSLEPFYDDQVKTPNVKA